jgi:tRNA (guanine26-N2/guanine27-N2)-dimethyltransferase
MESDPIKHGSSIVNTEGRIRLDIEPTGRKAGPGKRSGVFFNPAMMQNRDLSVLVLQLLLKNGQLVGKRRRVLDGLCGSGVRALRLAMETDLRKYGFEVEGTDIGQDSIDKALKLNSMNGLDIVFKRIDLNTHLVKERYSYIDIDPFGSPLPFLAAGINGTLNGGVLAFTATDTAALSGSIPRVARRRYGVEISMTHCYQEMSCRALLGYVARVAASFERGVHPLFIYSSDHFLRGYVRVNKGAKRADSTLENLGWVDYHFPAPPKAIGPAPSPEQGVAGRYMGPIWTGALEDVEFLEGLSSMLGDEGRWEYLSSFKELQRMIGRGKEESGFPAGGYDINETSGHLKVSPPSMGELKEGIEHAGGRFSRSRFSPTIFKTDQGWEEVKVLFQKGGK